MVFFQSHLSFTRKYARTQPSSGFNDSSRCVAVQARHCYNSVVQLSGVLKDTYKTIINIAKNNVR